MSLIEYSKWSTPREGQPRQNAKGAACLDEANFSSGDGMASSCKHDRDGEPFPNLTDVPALRSSHLSPWRTRKEKTGSLDRPVSPSRTMRGLDRRTDRPNSVIFSSRLWKERQETTTAQDGVMACQPGCMHICITQGQFRWMICPTTDHVLVRWA